MLTIVVGGKDVDEDIVIPRYIKMELKRKISVGVDMLDRIVLWCAHSSGVHVYMIA